MGISIYEIHEKLTAGLFPPYSNEDQHFLALALCGEAGELAEVVLALAIAIKVGKTANLIKKEWRDNVDLSEEVKDEIADVRVYLELLAKCYDIEGEKLDARVVSKLETVVEKHKARLQQGNTHD